MANPRPGSDPTRGPLATVRRVMVRTQSGPLRPLWWLAHEVLLRGVAAFLCRGIPEARAYGSGSSGHGEPLYGVSDVDLVVVLPEVAGAPGHAHGRVTRRWRRLCRLVPLLSPLFDVSVYERPELERAIAAPTFTHGLNGSGPDGAIYLGPRPLANHGLVEGPGVYGPLAEWRPLRGGQLPRPPEYDAQHRRMAAWLSVQSWWRFSFLAALRPAAPRTPYLAVKFVSEPARIWMWLVHGERFFGRRATLERALVLLPEEEPALRVALDLHRRLPRITDAPLDVLLTAFVRLSSRIAARVEEVWEAGATDVRLLGAGERSPGGDDLVPLADWRALVWSWIPDETLRARAGDPGELDVLARAARDGREGPYPALRAHGLLVLPSADEWRIRSRLRAIQCAATDPVSFALLDGRDSARFPDVAGWSARDWARRAVAEHAAWLRTDPAAQEAPPFARPLSAIRAALFLESLEAGDPELAVTLGAAARQLGERLPATRGLAEECAGAYRAWREDGVRPDAATLAGLYEATGRLLARPASAGVLV